MYKLLRNLLIAALVISQAQIAFANNDKLKNINQQISKITNSNLLALSHNTKQNSKLESLLQKRFKLVQSEINKANYQIVKKNLLSKASLAKIPNNLKSLLEEEAELEGTILSYYADNFEDHALSKLHYSLQVDNNFYELHSKDKFQATSSKQAKVRGIKLGNDIVIDSSNDIKFSKASSKKARSALVNIAQGTKKALVILADDSTIANSPDTFIYSEQEAFDKIFGADSKSLKKFFDESSYGQFNLEPGGTPNGILSVDIPNLCKNPNDTNLPARFTGAVQNILNHLAATGEINNINFAEVDFIDLVFPISKPELTINCSFRGGTAGIAVLVPIEYTLNDSSGTRTQSFRVNANLAFPYGFGQQVIAHEMGHNLGLLHAQGYECGNNSFDSLDNCSFVNYGDRFDVMGANFFHFNGANKHFLGWLQAQNIVTIDELNLTDQDIVLDPLESNSTNPQIIEVRRGNGTSLFIEKRAALGFDNIDLFGSNSNLKYGFQVRLAMSSSLYPFSDEVHYLTGLADINPLPVGAEGDQTSRDFTDASLSPGQQIIDNDFGIEITAIDDSTINVKRLNTVNPGPFTVNGRLVNALDNSPFLHSYFFVYREIMGNIFSLQTNVLGVPTDENGHFSFTVDGPGDYIIRKRDSTEGTFSYDELKINSDLSNFDLAVNTRYRPNAEFSYSINGNIATFSDLSTDRDGQISSWLWLNKLASNNENIYNLISYDQNPTYFFQEAGEYEVILQVEDNDGFISSITKNITLEAFGAVPQADITNVNYFNDPNEHRLLEFDGSGSSDADGTIVSYEWDFNIDGTINTTGAVVQHTFPEFSRIYDVRLIVTDNDGLKDSIDFAVEIPAAPRPTSGNSGGSGGSGANGGGASSGGGTSGGGSSGGSSSGSSTEETSNKNPNAKFDFTIDGFKVDFTNQSSDSDGRISKYAWDFGDGNTATSKNPSHSYERNGTYVVSLIVTDNDDASSTSSKQVIINVSNENSLNIVLEAFSEPVLSKDLSLFNVLIPEENIDKLSELKIDFDDDGIYDESYDGTLVSHRYNEAGTYQIKLRITDSSGAVSVVSQETTVLPLLELQSKSNKNSKFINEQGIIAAKLKTKLKFTLENKTVNKMNIKLKTDRSLRPFVKIRPPKVKLDAEQNSKRKVRIVLPSMQTVQDNIGIFETYIEDGELKIPVYILETKTRFRKTEYLKIKML